MLSISAGKAASCGRFDSEGSKERIATRLPASVPAAISGPSALHAAALNEAGSARRLEAPGADRQRGEVDPFEQRVGRFEAAQATVLHLADHPAAGDARRVDEEQAGRLGQPALGHEAVEDEQVAGPGVGRLVGARGPQPQLHAGDRGEGAGQRQRPGAVADQGDPLAARFGDRDEGGVVGGEAVGTDEADLRPCRPGAWGRSSGAEPPAGTSTFSVRGASPATAIRTGTSRAAPPWLVTRTNTSHASRAEPVAVGDGAAEADVFERSADHLFFVGGAAAAHLRRRFLGRPQQRHRAAVVGPQARGQPQRRGQVGGAAAGFELFDRAARRPRFAFVEDGRGRRRRRRSAPLRRRALRRAVRADRRGRLRSAMPPAFFGPHPHRLVDDVDVRGAGGRLLARRMGEGEDEERERQQLQREEQRQRRAADLAARRRRRPPAGRARRAGCRPRGAAACGAAGAARSAAPRGPARPAPRR